MGDGARPRARGDRREVVLRDVHARARRGAVIARGARRASFQWLLAERRRDADLLRLSLGWRVRHAG